MGRRGKSVWWQSRRRLGGKSVRAGRPLTAEARRSASLEWLEPRRLLAVDLFELDPPLTNWADAAVGTSLHERDWVSVGVLAEEGQPVGAPPFPLGDTFKLHSNPGATKVIYLDFDGHVTTGTAWNEYWRIPTITTPPYSFEGGPAFSDNELERIQIIWERVAEDFRPFDVNVTTEDPGVEALRRSNSSDARYGIRVVIGADQANTGAGGIAYIGSFTWNTDTPTFVFNNSLVGVAEAASHEVGHTLGLGHDGRGGGIEYYQGHGLGATGWAPIMGVGYDRQLVQWSRGQYPGANNSQDDLTIITTQNGFGYRADDHSNTPTGATALANEGTALSGEGIIERNTDVDYFQFASGGGALTINVDPFYRSPNLDILATLYNANGEVVATSNPVNALNATINVTVTAGIYYLAIDGIGKAANGTDYGYSDYASLGYYSITGVRPDPNLASINGLAWNDRDADGVRDADEPGLSGWTVFIDANGNGAHDESEVSATTDASGNYSISNLAEGTYVVAMVQRAGWQSTFPGSPSTYTVTLARGEQTFNRNFASRAGSIRGVKWFDRDRDGEQDPNEPGLADWTIYIDANNNGSLDAGERATTTDANGGYMFLDLLPGTYTVAEVMRPDWQQTAPGGAGTRSVTLGLGQQATGINFGNVVGSIGGFVWNDRDGDLVRDDGEPPLAGWRVFLDNNGNGLFDDGPSTFSNFESLPITDLHTTVSEITVTGLTSILDVDVVLNIEHTYAADLDVYLTSPNGTRIELFSDVGQNGDNFTNTRLSDEASQSITAGTAPFTGTYRPEQPLSMFDGQNPNGVWRLEVTDDLTSDTGQLLNWSLVITTQERSVLSDADGFYEFIELPGGDYTIGATPESLWAQTSPGAPGRYLVTLETGQAVQTANFGFRQASLSGQAFNDIDGDGLKDAGEPGLPGWIVFLDHNGNGSLDEDAQTATSTNVPRPIADLSTVTSTLTVSGLTVIEDINITFSLIHDFLADLDVYLISPSGTRVELFTDINGSGQSMQNTTLDDQATISIAATPGPSYTGSFKPEGQLAQFNGEDPNGVWRLEITDDGGNDVGVLQSWSLTILAHESRATTDAAGNYVFWDLKPGSYVARIIRPANWESTLPSHGGPVVATLTTGQSSTGNNFGSQQSALSGDYDRDGVVSGGDFLVWQRSVGHGAIPPGSGADGNGDGVVNGADLMIWRNSFGPAPETAASVLAPRPELENDDDAARDDAFAQLDAAALAGPWAYASTRSVRHAPARPAYRPIERVFLVLDAFRARLVDAGDAPVRPQLAANDRTANEQRPSEVGDPGDAVDSGL